MHLRFLVLASLGFAQLSSGRTILSLDADWRFFQGEAAGAEKPGFKDSDWRHVDVPHDWSIEGTFDQKAPATGSGGWLPTGVAWYRKELSLSADAKGKRVWIEFDGVMANSDVWLNGKLLGHRPNGYVSFRYDLTDFLDFSKANTLVVKADTSAQPASRWYAGSGINRHVRLVVADPVHVSPDGIYLTTPEVSAEKATLQITTKLTNLTTKNGPITLQSSLLTADGQELGHLESTVKLTAGKDADCSQQLTISKPQLWSVETPVLHTLVSRVMAGMTVLDEVRTPIGIRHFEFKSDTGFWLNGRNFKIKGVCLHQDAGLLGTAVPMDAWERRLKILQSLGVNAVRTAHTPVAPEFLDLCDRLGLLVMDESFDCWTKGKNAQDYHLYFDKWSQIDLRDTVLRDRNHPSVILYSVGNEIHDTQDAPLANRILTDLVKVCHENDPSRPVTQALFRPNVSHDYDNGLADLLDVVGTNYRDAELLAAWKAKPTRKIIGTEQGHDRTSWLACRDSAPYSGQFLWAGIDYLGESKTWPVTSYNAGLLDRTGFVQPRGYERQSWWSEKPMVRAFRRIGNTEKTPADPGYESIDWKRRQVLFPDWSPVDVAAHEESVEVYSNAEEVELFLNDESLGIQKVRKDAGALNWKVGYAPGSLKAIARSGGKEVATDLLRTAGKPAKLQLTVDHSSLKQDFDSVVHVEVRVVDENGITVPNASDSIKFTLTGPGKLLGADNGSVVDTDSFQNHERQAYQGRAIAILRATAGQGTITLKAEAEGLSAGSVGVTAKP